MHRKLPQGLEHHLPDCPLSLLRPDLPVTCVPGAALDWVLWAVCCHGGLRHGLRQVPGERPEEWLVRFLPCIHLPLC